MVHSRVQWRPPHLREAQTAFDALQEFACDFVAHDMCRVFITFMQLLARRSLVDTHHGYTDGPSTETQQRQYV
jgi:hypothetical protein